MTWHQYALSIARTVSGRSKDPWKRVGACVLRHDNSVASVGYNGFPAGMPEKWSERDERRKFVIHAEANALRYVQPGEGRVIACTMLPCNDCLRLIASYRINTIVYGETYVLDESTHELATCFGINLIHLP
jgi:dCMP deaminase